MFLLFVGAHYYPKGGWFDFVGAYETLSEAKSQLKSKESEAVARGWSIWGHIADTESMSLAHALHGHYEA